MRVTLEDTKRASVLLIRKLFLLMQNLDVLPSNVHLTMKLYYYDDSKCLTRTGTHHFTLLGCRAKTSPPALPSVTPADYEPPGFKEGECDSLWFEGVAVHFKVGEVQTAFHTLKVRVSAEQGRMKKLQEGNHVRETRQIPPEGETIKVCPGRELLRCWTFVFSAHFLSVIMMCYKNLITGSL